MDRVELHRVFRMFDRNRDGMITKEEFGDLVESLGIFISDQELSQIIESIDVKGDGFMDIDKFGILYQMIVNEHNDEFGILYQMIVNEHNEEDMMEAFNIFDQNRDGFITLEELRSVLSLLGLEQGRAIEDCKKMITKADADGDGRVNFREFKQMMKGGGFAALRSS